MPGRYTTPLSLTSQFFFCGLPLRLDSYRGCHLSNVRFAMRDFAAATFPAPRCSPPTPIRCGESWHEPWARTDGAGETSSANFSASRCRSTLAG